MSRVSLDAFRHRVQIAPDITLSVVDTGGSGAALLLLHGAAGRSNHWIDQISYFTPRYRCVAPDMRGHGASDKPPSAYTLAEQLADLDVVVERLGMPDKFVVVGHSFGGALAMSYAATRQPRVDKLVLIATSTVIPLNPMLKLLMRLPPWTLEIVRRLMPDRLSCPAHVLRKLIPRAVFPWQGDAMMADIKAPTMIVIGERDRVVPRASTDKLSTGIADATLEVIRHAAHMPLMERPDAVNRAIERFVEARVTSWRGVVEEVPVPQVRTPPA